MEENTTYAEGVLAVSNIFMDQFLDQIMVIEMAANIVKKGDVQTAVEVRLRAFKHLLHCAQTLAEKFTGLG